MNVNNEPLNVLLELNKKLSLNLDDELITQCYKLQKTHQYDKNRDTSKKMQALIETKVLESEGNILL